MRPKVTRIGPGDFVEFGVRLAGQPRCFVAFVADSCGKRRPPLSSRSVSSSVPMLFVTWQAPESRRIFPIARVMRRPSGDYEWAYVRAVSDARAQGFVGLPGYEDLDAVCVSPGLPALFAHRLPPRGRRRAAPGTQPANDLFDPTPITLLVPLGSGTNERLEVFAPPLPAPLGKAWGVFVARGVGRTPGSEVAVESLTPHERLLLWPEPDNAYNRRALLLLREDRTPSGLRAGLPRQRARRSPGPALSTGGGPSLGRACARRS